MGGCSSSRERRGDRLVDRRIVPHDRLVRLCDLKARAACTVLRRRGVANNDTDEQLTISFHDVNPGFHALTRDAIHPRKSLIEHPEIVQRLKSQHDEWVKEVQ